MRSLLERLQQKILIKDRTPRLEWLSDYSLAGDLKGPCWIWGGSLSVSGSRRRPVVSSNGGVSNTKIIDSPRPKLVFHGKLLWVHRVLWQKPIDTESSCIEYKSPLEGGVVLKKQDFCSNDRCCNPAHFEEWKRRDLKGHRTLLESFQTKDMADPILDAIDDLQVLYDRPGSEDLTIDQLQEHLGQDYNLAQLKEAILKGGFEMWHKLIN